MTEFEYDVALIFTTALVIVFSKHLGIRPKDIKAEIKLNNDKSEDEAEKAYRSVGLWRTYGIYVVMSLAWIEFVLRRLL